MNKGSWRKWVGDQDKPIEMFKKTEKIGKKQRSNKGRVVDDWIIDASESGKSLLARLEELKVQGHRVGRVVEAHKRYVFVAEEMEEKKPDTNLLWLCTIAKRHFQRSHVERNFVVVGDKILFVPDADVVYDDQGEVINTDLPRGTIQHAFQRVSSIARRDPLRPQWSHVMLANIDYVVVVASVFYPEVRWGLIDRILVQAENFGVEPVIVLNKIDLLQNPKLATPAFREKYKQRVENYRKIGYQVFEVSALKQNLSKGDLTALRELIKGKLIGFAGHSGVGKSSLLNLMRPEFDQVVDDTPEIFYKGRHTTTYNSLIRLDIGAYAIDTPGIRSFDIQESDAIRLSYLFREFRGHQCKFRECSHDGEQDCAIKKAVETGEISKDRYRSYLGILKGVSFREGAVTDAGQSATEADVRARLQFQEGQEDLESEGSSDEEGTDTHALGDLSSPSETTLGTIPMESLATEPKPLPKNALLRKKLLLKTHQDT
jgi:ribosome biogenesis GTPase